MQGGGTGLQQYHFRHLQHACQFGFKRLNLRPHANPPGPQHPADGIDFLVGEIGTAKRQIVWTDFQGETRSVAIDRSARACGFFPKKAGDRGYSRWIVTIHRAATVDGVTPILNERIFCVTRSTGISPLLRADSSATTESEHSCLKAEPLQRWGGEARSASPALADAATPRKMKAQAAELVGKAGCPLGYPAKVENSGPGKIKTFGNAYCTGPGDLDSSLPLALPPCLSPEVASG